MKEYHKIQTVFKRDPENNNKTLLDGEFSLPEFEYLADNEWIFTEKVDGTNIRVIWQPQEEQPIRFAGKTERAQIPTVLYDRLVGLFDYEKFQQFGETTENYMCLYGEGYGTRIQKSGGNYKTDGVDFVLFDVRVGDWWLQRKDVEDIAGKLGIDFVPVIGKGTLWQMVDDTRQGFESQWGSFVAEGIVARPATELKARNGNRIITKIKHKDFKEVK